VHGITEDESSDELRELFGLIEDEGLIAVSTGEYRTVAVTAAGREFLTNRSSLTLSRVPQADSDVGGSPEDLSYPRARKNSRNTYLDYDRGLFELLRALRKQVADDKNVPAYVIFGDASIAEMAYYMPNDRDNFSAVSGVGATKLEQFADRFLSVIVEYCEQNGLAQKGRLLSRAGLRARAPRKARRRSTLSTSLTETKRLYTDGYSVDEIASERGFAAKTIVTHLEKIARFDPEFDLERLMPAPERTEVIRAALQSEGSGYLNPVKEKLGHDYSYEEIRMVRLQIERSIESLEQADG
jgi:ATP-dependent DNA helicase RecQ